MRNEEPISGDKGVLRKIRWKSEVGIAVMLLEWLIPWRWARHPIRILVVIVILGIWLLWLADLFLRIRG